MLSNNIGKVKTGKVIVESSNKKISVTWALYYLEDGWHIFIRYTDPKAKRPIKTELPFGGPLAPTRIQAAIKEYIHKHVR